MGLDDCATPCNTCPTGAMCRFYGVCLEGRGEKAPMKVPRDEQVKQPPPKRKPRWKVEGR